jgi:hypothetical protein
MVIISVLASSVVSRGFEPRSGQILKLNHGESRLNFMRWEWYPLCTRSTRWIWFLIWPLVSSNSSHWNNSPGVDMLALNNNRSLILCLTNQWLAFVKYYMNRCVIDRRIKLVFQFTSVPYIHRYMFESRLYRGVLDKTLCDKACQWLVTLNGQF